VSVKPTNWKRTALVMLWKRRRAPTTGSAGPVTLHSGPSRPGGHKPGRFRPKHGYQFGFESSDSDPVLTREFGCRSLMFIRESRRVRRPGNGLRSEPPALSATDQSVG
jgi:hypothetical protein